MSELVELNVDVSCLDGLPVEAKKKVIEIANRVVDGKVDPANARAVVASLHVWHGHEAVEALDDLCDQIIAMREVA